VNRHISRPLNATLYKRMVQQFGEVLIAKPGEAMVGGGMMMNRGKLRYTPLSSGEYYRVNCPYCLQRNSVDTKHRLWINHRWGVGLDPGMPFYDPQDKFWHMAVCYNENCLESSANRRDLRIRLYTGIGRELHRGETVKIAQGTVSYASLGVTDYPGYCQRVDTLSSDHCANQYLIGRGFDPKMLGEVYDVSYCHNSDQYPLVTGRIVVPIHMNGQMVGWQARPPYDADWKAIRQPKYYNCPGTNKRLMLYGLQQAEYSPFCTVVEGVTDVWKLGAGAVCVLGCTMSPQQAAWINSRWSVAFIALDSDATKKAEDTKRILEQSGNTTAVVVPMPAGLDPATMNNDCFWDLVAARCDEEGVDI